MKFMMKVLEASVKRVEYIKKGSHLWRAQLGHSWKPEYQDDILIGDLPAPYPSERMLPLRHEASEGRANPKGIPYLYTATTKETAMAEVRPWLGSTVSVGSFKTLKKMKLVDCSVNTNKFTIYFKEPSPKKREEAVWADIDTAFSKPMTNTDRVADYVPTQVMAEFFKHNGFDGIAYKSMLAEGHNIVFFDLDSIKLLSCHLFDLKDLKFKFNESANPYYVTE
ncbi:RES family NAD+ phosphorylase [Desulforhopalus sp. IMCC35007]|uniref:RES family NAD+ phosphorylase n=1 Tax=Desulforhopalus sp. IMCC35007 TaxID=2569543 RepID=UPI00197AD8C9|nr:RES family NAD+ phosphorylase [Desulforhopalus sp. IMCC35007]